MASQTSRLVARVTPEFRRELQAELAKINATTNAELSESQFVQMAVKFFMDQVAKNGVTIGGPKTIPFPGATPPPAPVGLVAEDPEPYGVPAPEHLRNPPQPNRTKPAKRA